MAVKKMKKLQPMTNIVCCMILLFAGAQDAVYGRPFQQDSQPTAVEVTDDSGKFEIGIYYARWTLNPIISSFRDSLNEELGKQIRDDVVDRVLDKYNRFLRPTDFEEDFSFDASGPNYGIEFRYYPQGRLGSFSMGLSLDKIKMRIAGEGSVRQNFDDQTYAEADGSGEIILSPIFTSLSFRWDFMPRWRVTPYYSMGLGLAVVGKEKRSGETVDYDKSDRITWEYEGFYHWVTGPIKLDEGGDQLTLKEAEEEGDFNIPNIFPLIMINFGVRAEIMPYLYLRGEVGFYDGLAVRFGISGRF